MAAITGRGDDGETDLLFGQRVAKDSCRIEALGAIDELNAALGIARAGALGEAGEGAVDGIQQRLVALMGQLACRPDCAERHADAGFACITEADVGWLEGLAARLEAAGANPHDWARPGAEGRLAAAALDLARAVARRAERRVWTVHRHDGPVAREVRLFLNRLSDALWLLARQAARG